MNNIENFTSPFKNDPFAMVNSAFNKLYPNKNYSAYWEPDINKDVNGEQVFGCTAYCEKTDEYLVFIDPFIEVKDAVEIFAHELAHVAAGLEKDHGETWECAFNAILNEYDNIGEMLFSSDEKNINKDT